MTTCNSICLAATKRLLRLTQHVCNASGNRVVSSIGEVCRWGGRREVAGEYVEVDVVNSARLWGVWDPRGLVRAQGLWGSGRRGLAGQVVDIHAVC